MKQQTLATAADQGAGFEQYRRATKRDVFLATMNEIVPWQALCEVIEPTTPRLATAARRSAWSACCGCTSFSIGSTWPTRHAKKRCRAAPSCDASWAPARSWTPPSS